MDRIFNGVVTHIGEMKQGLTKKGEEWKKQNFVVTDESGKYPEVAVFSLFGDNIDRLKYFKIGSPISVGYNCKGYGYNGQFYNELQAWKVNKPETNAPKTTNTPELNGDMANEFNKSQSIVEDSFDLPF